MTDTNPLGPDRHLRWKDRNESDVPERDLDPQGHPGATFVTKKVYRVVSQDQGKKLRVLDSSLGLGSVEPDPASVYEFQHTKKGDPEQKMVYRSSRGGSLELKPYDEYGSNAVLTLDDGRELTPVKEATESRSNQVFGGTFNLPERVQFDEWMFRGHNIFTMNPKNLLASVGEASARQHIFKYAAPDSKDFKDASDINRFVPIGVSVLGENFERRETDQHVVTSEAEYQVSWKASVGAKAGIAGFASFAASEEFRQGEQSQWRNSAGTTSSNDVFYSFALVLDPWHGKLDAGFEERVEELWDYVDSSELNDHLDRFLDAFGTHYAYAVTFGRITRTESRFTKAGMTKVMQSGQALSYSAEGSFEGVTAGASASASIDETTKHSLDTEDCETESKTYGEGANVPIMVDLRPISELMNPVFLADVDEGILGRLRSKLADRIVYRARQQPPFSQRSLLPLPVYAVKICALAGVGRLLSEIHDLEIRLEIPPQENLRPGTDLRPVTTDKSVWHLPKPVSSANVENLAINYVHRTIVLYWYPPYEVHVRMTLKGKWTDSQDSDIHDRVVGKIPFSDFSATAKTRTIVIPRDRSELELTVAFRNVGGKSALNGWPH